jgi:hypothetical protein
VAAPAINGSSQLNSVNSFSEAELVSELARKHAAARLYVGAAARNAEVQSDPLRSHGKQFFFPSFHQEGMQHRPWFVRPFSGVDRTAEGLFAPISKYKMSGIPKMAHCHRVLTIWLTKGILAGKVLLWFAGNDHNCSYPIVKQFNCRRTACTTYGPFSTYDPI